VDAVEIFEEATPERLLREWRPDIFAKGGDYHHSTVPEAPAVHAYGGEVVVLPTLAGRSSTRLVDAARAGAHAQPEEEQCRTRTA
jgi:bifunctional ADP-heptose synthase (sugar kinase/adenylyltransferase)